MANIKKSIKKNIKRNKEKLKEENMKGNNILTTFKIIYIIFVVLIGIYFIGSLIQGTYKLNFEEVKISDNTIIAGQVFGKEDNEYYVILSDFTKESFENEIDSLPSETVVYLVNLASAMNKSIISNQSNKDAQSSSELKISDSTLIKIKDGKNVEYVEGNDNIKIYLSNIK